MMTHTLRLLLASIVMAAFPPAAAKIIRPVKVTGSSYVSFPQKRERHQPELIADGEIGNPQSYWASNFKDPKAPRPHVLEFDFGQPVTFKAIKLDMIERYDLRAYLNTYQLDYFDGNRYHQLVRRENCVRVSMANLASNDFKRRYARTPNAHPVFAFPAVTGTKVRLTIWDSIGRLDEMTVYDEPPQTPTLQTPDQARLATPTVTKYTFTPPWIELAPGFVRGQVDRREGVLFVDRSSPLEAVRRNFVAGEGDNSITIPVPQPGFYDVFVMSGDRFAASLGLRGTINGKNLWLPQAHAGDFPWRTLTVRADADIKLQMRGPWLVNAIFIAPLAERRSFQEAVCQTVLGTVYRRFRHDPQVTHTAKPSVTDADLKRGFLPYLPALDQKIFAQTTPRPDQRLTVLRERAATDSRKAISVAFHALRHLDNFQVTYEGQLPMTVHPIRQWIQRTGQKGAQRLYDIVPEILDDNDRLFIRQGDSRQFYVMVDIPVGTRPGTYEGRLTVTADGIPDATFPVSFEVLPFQLDTLDPDQYVAMYIYNVHHDILKGTEPELDRRLLQDLRSHHVNSVFFPDSTYQSAQAFERLYVHLNQELDRAGFPRHPLMWNNQRITPQVAAEVMEIVRRTGLREIVFYPVDEPRFGRKELAKRLYPMLKKIPGARTYSTVSQDILDYVGAKNFDFQCFMITDYAEFDADRIRRDCQRDGTHFWWYSNAAREYPAVNRYKAGFFTWRCGSTGQTYWNYSNPLDDAWNDCDGQEHDHNSIYLMEGKIYTTIQWEAIREGLEDLRYIHTLERLIKQKQGTREAQEARQVLQGIRKQVVVDLKTFKKTFGSALDIHRCCLWPPEQFADARNQIIKAILTLNH